MKTILEYLLIKTNVLKLAKVIKNHPNFYLLSTFLQRISLTYFQLSDLNVL